MLELMHQEQTNLFIAWKIEKVGIDNPCRVLFWGFGWKSTTWWLIISFFWNSGFISYAMMSRFRPSSTIFIASSHLLCIWCVAPVCIWISKLYLRIDLPKNRYFSRFPKCPVLVEYLSLCYWQFLSRRNVQIYIAAYILSDSIFFPGLWRNGLSALCRAVGQQGARVKASVLATRFFGSAPMEVFALCQHYGLAVDQKEQEVVLSRTAFKREAPMVSPSMNSVSVRISFFGYCRRDGNAMQKCRSGEGVGASYVFGAMQILIRYLHLACFDIVDFFRDSRDS